MHSEWLWVAGGLWHVPFLPFQPAKWWKQQFGPGVRDIIKEKGCLQLLHLTGNCQLTLTKKGISALAAAFKGSVIRWHYKYRIVHGGGGTSGCWTWQFCFSCARLEPVSVYLKQNQLHIHLGFMHSVNTLNCNRGCLYLKYSNPQLHEVSHLQFQEEWDDWWHRAYENYASDLTHTLYVSVQYRVSIQWAANNEFSVSLPILHNIQHSENN